jgi:hypothetical protein
MTKISINVVLDYLFQERIFKLGTLRMPARYVTLRSKLSVGMGTLVRVNETVGDCTKRIFDLLIACDIRNRFFLCFVLVSELFTVIKVTLVK